jgi:hypothetical protein
MVTKAGTVPGGSISRTQKAAALIALSALLAILAVPTQSSAATQCVGRVALLAPTHDYVLACTFIYQGGPVVVQGVTVGAALTLVAHQYTSYYVGCSGHITYLLGPCRTKSQSPAFAVGAPVRCEAHVIPFGKRVPALGFFMCASGALAI